MPPEKKRVVSEKRKLQNKQAQKNYRERQKKQLQLLQNLAGYQNGVAIDTQLKSPPATDFPKHVLEIGSLEQYSSTGSSSASILSEPPESGYLGSERDNDFTIAETSSPHTIQSYVNTQFHPRNNHKIGCSRWKGKSDSNTALSQLLDSDFSLEEVLEAGIKALSRQNDPESSDVTLEESTTPPKLIVKLEKQQRSFDTYLPDIHRNNLRINQINLVAASIANLNALGQTSAVLSDLDAESFFFCASNAAGVLLTTQDFSYLTCDLRPTPAQLTYEHHPYIDCIPFPDFRERLLKLIVVDPQIEYDFCDDIEKDALICWGSAMAGQSQGAGSGAPWDMRSWEARPWFIKKWWMIVGGPDGDLYKQSRWWCEMRGDTLDYPW